MNTREALTAANKIKQRFLTCLRCGLILWVIQKLQCRAIQKDRIVLCQVCRVDVCRVIGNGSGYAPVFSPIAFTVSAAKGIEECTNPAALQSTNTLRGF